MLRPVLDGPDFKPYQYPKIRVLDHWHDHYHNKYVTKDHSAALFDGLIESVYLEVGVHSISHTGDHSLAGVWWDAAGEG